MCTILILFTLCCCSIIDHSGRFSYFRSSLSHLKNKIVISGLQFVFTFMISYPGKKLQQMFYCFSFQFQSIRNSQELTILFYTSTEEGPLCRQLFLFCWKSSNNSFSLFISFMKRLMSDIVSYGEIQHLSFFFSSLTQ